MIPIKIRQRQLVSLVFRDKLVLKQIKQASKNRPVVNLCWLIGISANGRCVTHILTWIIRSIQTHASWCNRCAIGGSAIPNNVPVNPIITVYSINCTKIIFETKDPKGSDWNLMMRIGVVNIHGAIPIDINSFSLGENRFGSCCFTKSVPKTN